jgi:DNA-directed RNA polymerase specialized sigma24 family protein
MATNPMADQSITGWIRGSEAGDGQSQEKLWNHYFDRVVRLARSRMYAIQASVYDEEDAAVSALNSLFRGIRKNQYPDLHSRDNLWRLLILITHRKLIAQKRRQAARISPAVQDEASERIDQIVSSEPTPELVAEVMDETERLLKLLGEDKLRRIAVMRMDGLSTEEIAVRLGSTSRTIRRKLERIRDIWEVPNDD